MKGLKIKCIGEFLKINSRKIIQELLCSFGRTMIQVDTAFFWNPQTG